MNTKLTICIVLATLVAYVTSHVVMVNPPSRGVVHIAYPDKGYKTSGQDYTRWCGTYDRRNPDNTTCGVCGSVFDGDNNAMKLVYHPHDKLFHEPSWSYERDGPMYTGQITATYKKNQTIDIFMALRAGHRGNYIWRICDAKNNDPTEECFAQNVLEFAEEGRTVFNQAEEPFSFWRMQNSDGTSKRWWGQATRLRLPENLTCEHCVLQWSWPNNRARQEYRSCSDITITN